MKCTTTNILYKWAEDKKTKIGEIELVKEPKRDVRWAKCLVSGPDSVIKPGDDMLLSARVVSYVFSHKGEEYMNTSDDSTLCYKHNGKLEATTDHLILEWLESFEEVSEGGIVIIRKEINKETIVRRAKVIAAGPRCNVKENDIIFAAYNKDAYELLIDGKIYRNADDNAVICVEE